MTNSRRYVLVTPTRDEEATIQITIDSVLAQTLRPAEWVIVSDGSTDQTDAIIEAAQAEHSWIKLIKLPLREGRCFGAVARATKLATQELSIRDYAYLGLLDSDLRFAPDYFESVVSTFECNPNLGLAGGRAVDIGLRQDVLPDNLHDVPGAVQFFRRECFESLGDILAIPEGGWDMVTCAEARMNGFETRLLTELIVDHLKPRNIAHGGILRRRWQCGVRDYVLGYHPIFEAVKCLRRVRQSPFMISAISWWLGYVTSLLTKRERMIPQDVLSFIQKEQMIRVRALFVPGRSRADA